MKLNSLDVLFSHPLYGGAEIAIAFNERLEQDRLQKALDELCQINPILGMKLDYSKTTKFITSGKKNTILHVDISSGDCKLDKPQDFIPYLKRVRSGDESLFSLRHLQTRNKSYLIMSFAHVLGDGNSLFQFLITLGQIYGHKFPMPWETDRESFTQAALAKGPLIFKDLPPESVGFISTHEYSPTEEKDIQRDPLEIVPQSELEEFKRKFPHLTSFEFMAAKILKKKSQEITAEEISVICPINLRMSISEIPFFYFGNAVKGEIQHLKRKAILADSVDAVATKIKEIKLGFKPENFYHAVAYLEYLRKEKGDDYLRTLRVTTNTSVLITDLTKIPNKIEFGSNFTTEMVMLSNYPQAAAIVRHPEGLAFQTAKIILPQT